MLVNFNTVVGSFILEALVLWFQQLGKNDVEIVGGKNASLGEMISNFWVCLSPVDLPQQHKRTVTF